MRVLINILGFQVAWFALVWGAAHGEVWWGVAVLLGVVSVHLLSSGEHAADEFALLAIVAWIGYIADSSLTLLGVLDFPPQAQAGGPAPIWMTALWVNFAATLNVSLRWAADRPGLAVALGALGGPLAYYAGAAMGALSFGASLPTSLAMIGVQWGLATPVLAVVGRWARSQRSSAEAVKGAQL